MPLPVSGSPTPPAPIVPPAGTVVARGTIVSQLPGVHGEVEIISAPDTAIADSFANFQVRISGFVLPANRDMSEFRLVARTTSFDEPCIAAWGGAAVGEWTLDEEAWTAWTGYHYPASDQPPMQDAEDPSFLESLVMLSAAKPADEQGCYYTPVISAELVWTMPETRPYLDPHDSGPREGAQGVVTQVGTKPSSYVTAPSDTVTNVSERFGITANDLAYLNPARVTAGPPDQLRVGERLNLLYEER